VTWITLPRTNAVAGKTHGGVRATNHANGNDAGQEFIRAAIMQLSQQEMKMTTIDMEGLRELTDAELNSVVGGALNLPDIVGGAKAGAQTGNSIGKSLTGGSELGGAIGGVIGAVVGAISGVFS
jgi:Bacteriocin class II with double-glycine leader peptide